MVDVCAGGFGGDPDCVFYGGVPECESGGGGSCEEFAKRVGAREREGEREREREGESGRKQAVC